MPAIWYFVVQFTNIVIQTVVTNSTPGRWQMPHREFDVTGLPRSSETHTREKWGKELCSGGNSRCKGKKARKGLVQPGKARTMLFTVFSDHLAMDSKATWLLIMRREIETPCAGM